MLSLTSNDLQVDMLLRRVAQGLSWFPRWPVQDLGWLLLSMIQNYKMQWLWSHTRGSSLTDESIENFFAKQCATQSITTNTSIQNHTFSNFTNCTINLNVVDGFSVWNDEENAKGLVQQQVGDWKFVSFTSMPIAKCLSFLSMVHLFRYSYSIALRVFVIHVGLTWDQEYMNSVYFLENRSSHFERTFKTLSHWALDENHFVHLFNNCL